MLASNLYLPTLKEDPKEAEVVSHKLMLRAGMIKRLSQGLYTWLPLGLKVLRTVENTVRKELNNIGAQEILMPAVQPAELWQETNRWEDFGPLLLKIEDRNKREYCFGPTHEEVVTDLVRGVLKSYKQLPLCLYQIQTKFRDEIRPRFGVMRAREFLMKDAYSFHIDMASLEKTYDDMYQAYSNIFNALGLKFRAVMADSGAIGGSKSQEFHVLAETGEDELLYSDSSELAMNVEVANGLKAGDASPDGKGTLKSARGIEVGHIFQLGDKYSKSMNLLVNEPNGKTMHPLMGCYGIGVSRIVAAAIEQNHDANGIIWPKNLAPFKVAITPIGYHNSPEIKETADELYRLFMNELHEDILLYNLNESPGIMFKVTDLIGVPARVVVSKKLLEVNKFEIKFRNSDESITVSKEELIKHLKEVI